MYLVKVFLQRNKFKREICKVRKFYPKKGIAMKRHIIFNAFTSKVTTLDVKKSKPILITISTVKYFLFDNHTEIPFMDVQINDCYKLLSTEKSIKDLV